MSTFRFLSGAVALLALVILTATPTIVFGQNSATFAPTEVSNDFPNSITFDSQAVSTGADIVKAQFVYYLDRYGASDSTTRENLDIQPGDTVALHYQWDTHDASVVPWSPIVFRWRITDADGNIFESDPQRATYADTRFDWQTRKNDDIIVLWHDKPAIFGDKVFEIAQKAIKRQRKLFGVTPAIPIRIIVYNSQDEFNAWHSVGLDWVGGEAYPAFGITTQIVTSRYPDSHWLNDVVPHEISHLLLYQAAYNPTAPIPAWLNEGIAQYNQFGGKDTDYLVKAAAKEDKLIPLTSLAAGFGSHDEPRIRLSYAEGLSAVTYLVKTYGEAGLARLLSDYKKGLVTDDAFKDALGVDMGTFQQDWAVWLGAPRNTMITPTPWPLPTFPPSPTPIHAGEKATPAIAITPAPTKTSQPTPSATLTSTATPPASAGENGGLTPPCPGLFILIPIPLAAIFWQKRRSAR